MAQLIPGERDHHVDNLVITCSDHRFQQPIDEALKQLGVNEFDRIAYPGASKAVVDRKLNDAIIILKQLHDFKNIHIIDHTDCGGFGSLEAYGFDEKEEADAHFKMLQKASGVIAAILPRAVVVEHVIGLHGEEIRQGDDPRLGPSRRDT